MAPNQFIDLCDSDDEERNGSMPTRQLKRPSLNGKRNPATEPRKDPVVANTKRPRGSLFSKALPRLDQPHLDQRKDAKDTTNAAQLTGNGDGNKRKPHEPPATPDSAKQKVTQHDQRTKIVRHSGAKASYQKPPSGSDASEDELVDASSFVMPVERAGRIRTQLAPLGLGAQVTKSMASVSATSPLKRRRDDASQTNPYRHLKKPKTHIGSSSGRLSAREESTSAKQSDVPSKQRRSVPHAHRPSIDLTDDSPGKSIKSVVSLLSDEECEKRASPSMEKLSAASRRPTPKATHRLGESRKEHRVVGPSPAPAKSTGSASEVKQDPLPKVNTTATPDSAASSMTKSRSRASKIVRKGSASQEGEDTLRESQGRIPMKAISDRNLSQERELEIAESPEGSAAIENRTTVDDEVHGKKPEAAPQVLPPGAKSVRSHEDSGYTSLESHDDLDAGVASTRTSTAVCGLTDVEVPTRQDLSKDKTRGSLENALEAPSAHSDFEAFETSKLNRRNVPMQSISVAEEEHIEPGRQVIASVEESPIRSTRTRQITVTSPEKESGDREAKALGNELSNGSCKTLAPQHVSQVNTDQNTSEEGTSGKAMSKDPSSPIPFTTTLSNQVERVIGRQLEELRNDSDYWTRAWMKRARASPGSVMGCAAGNVALTGHVDEKYSFATMKPVQTLRLSKNVKPVSKDGVLFTTERVASSGVKASKTPMTVLVTEFGGVSDTMPSYSHYVSIKNNFLAPNTMTMHCWPYFGDEFEMEKADGLKEQYKLDIVERERKVKQVIQAEKYEGYVKIAMDELQIGWADILHLLYQDHPDVGDNVGAKSALKARPDYCVEDFTRDTSRKAIVLSSLPDTGPEKLARAALLCEHFQHLFKLRLWHIARRHQFDFVDETKHLADNKDVKQSLLDALTCRICLRFDCPYHGELNEHEDDYSEEGSDSIADNAIVTDIEHPPTINHRTRATFESPESGSNDIDADSARAGVIRHSQHSVQYWQSNYNYRPDERGPFYPCHHPGSSCSEAKCSCFANKIPCEKTCSCPLDCTRKFRGCSCAAKGQQKGHKFTCFEDDRCVCFQLGKECDPDLCGSCGACEVVDPIHRHDDHVLLGRCRNASIQRGVTKHTLLGDSGIHGLGLYAGEAVSQHEFVGEYKGEIITKDEAERRGAVYEHQKLSYLFSLNANQEIDSTYFGNRIRFINHAHSGKSNLYPRVVMVNNVHRIGLYGNRPIKKGEELFFDYGPQFPNEQLGGKTARDSAPHVRNANLVRDEFWDMEEAEDELGNRRARKMTKGKGRPRKIEVADKTSAVKQKGGPRPGAGRKPKAAKVLEPNEVFSSPGSDDDSDDADSSVRRPPAERLAAYNISDDSRESAMDYNETGGASEDDDFDPEASVSEASEDSSTSEEDF